MFKNINMVFVIMVSAFLLLPAAEKCFAQTSTPADENQLVLTLKRGDIVIKLRPDLAPENVAQVKKLTVEGAYNNVVFHRVIAGFMAQTGDVIYGKRGSPDFDLSRAGTGKSKYTDLPAEFSSEPFLRGTVGMARGSAPDSANSQFFICFAPAPFLNGQYTVIGQVVKGFDILDTIKKGNTNDNGAVDDPDTIISARLTSVKP